MPRKNQKQLRLFRSRYIITTPKHQHGNKNRWWIYRRYFTDNHFTDKRVGKKGTQHHRLYRISYVPIRYHVKIKSKANPFMPEFDKYLFQRQKWREDLAKVCKQITTFVQIETKNNSRVSLHRESLKSA
jgi:RNA-directed DNA polymerase